MLLFVRPTYSEAESFFLPGKMFSFGTKESWKVIFHWATFQQRSIMMAFPCNLVWPELVNCNQRKGKKKRLSLSRRVANLLHNNMILNHHTENFYTSMSVIPNCAGVYKVSQLDIKSVTAKSTNFIWPITTGFIQIFGSLHTRRLHRRKKKIKLIYGFKAIPGKNKF